MQQVPRYIAWPWQRRTSRSAGAAWGFTWAATLGGYGRIKSSPADGHQGSCLQPRQVNLPCVWRRASGAL